MQAHVPRHATRALLYAAVVALLGAGAVPAEAGRPRDPFLDIHSAARLAPDGRSLTVDLLWSCPLRWTVDQSVLVVSQPQASGRASFTATCVDQVLPITVTVPATAGTFQLGEAEVNAAIVISRGKTQSVEDAQVVDVQPSVFVDLADSARLEAGGVTVAIDVTVACPVGASGHPTSYVNVTQGETTGSGNYTPVCDGSPHTFAVMVQASRGVYQPGTAQALTFADVVHDGIAFSGVDQGAVQIVS